jgi:hypothetical protein
LLSAILKRDAHADADRLGEYKHTIETKCGLTEDIFAAQRISLVSFFSLVITA